MNILHRITAYAFFIALLICSRGYSTSDGLTTQKREQMKQLFAREGRLVLRQKNKLWVYSPTRNYVHCVADQALNKPRISSGPLITGDGFRSISDHIYDEKSLNFNPDSVNPGDIVFVNTMFFDDFIDRFHRKIRHPYILITHNGDFSMPGPHRNLLEDENIIAWFSVNLENCQHPKAYGLPIGIPNVWLEKENLNKLLKFYKHKPTPKKHLSYLNFNPKTHERERNFVLDFFKHQDFVFHRNRVKYRTYILDLMESKFVISPRGNGLDCYRHWESLYAGSIPIVISSSLDPLFENLPVLIIDSWEEISPEYLKQKYTEISNEGFFLKKLNLEYWTNKIFEVKNHYLNSQ